MGDRSHVERIAAQAREAVLAVPELRAAHHASRLIGQIADGVGAKRIQSTPASELQRVMARYREEVTAKAAAFWSRRRRRQKIRDVAVAMGARRLKRWLVTPR